ncbi:MAG: hypothetical protein EOP33_01165 [Rickettsiaceae bacterium]|nr:MAG: hypothetical protein EOP33_01165 [Rickettsiaceae bacterium]
MHNIKIICLALLTTLPALSNAALEIRNIAPPKLGKMHFGKEILFYRPMRLGRPKMTIKNTGNKIITNNWW